MKNTVTLPAEKVHSTVAMDKVDYCEEVENLLMDKDSREALAAKAADAAIARFYGPPNVHKQGVPLRTIVSLRGTPTFGSSKWLYQRLCFITKDSEWTVKSAKELLARIQHLELEADEVMVSFDVISLFTSIPPNLALETCDGLL
ncbi:unnamed protein product [Dibothriocephalus latus]|uniref:Reverse transcriptase domain-containing protein n=1 Tax=Dibothriocephalus latus TaxID=60516 RepID=A0A3P7NH55_DIBLA|nr:unnamed protein product [Dibothriocephalus latus]